MKEVLIVYYSQTGQAYKCAKALVTPLIERGVKVSECQIEPSKPYPFPWPTKKFFGVFSDCVTGSVPEIQPVMSEKIASADLIVLSTQVWFLSPSLPIQAFLKSTEAKLLSGKKVLTIISCRNMWQNAYRAIMKQLSHLSAHHVGNIVATDESSMISSFIMTPRWLLTGKKNPLFGILQRPGLTEQQIQSFSRFAKPIYDQFDYLDEHKTLSFSNLNPVTVEERLIMPEWVGIRIFKFFALFSTKAKKLNSTLKLFADFCFVIVLFFSIVLLIPTLLVFTALSRPFLGPRLKREIKYLMSTAN